jgi:hypothetical protein
MNTVWTDTDQKMLQLISVKKSIEEIAKVQKRSVSTINSRLKVLAADMYFNQKMPYEQVEARTGIKKDILLVRRQKIQISEDKEPEVKPMLEDIPETMPLVNKVTVATVAPITREIVTQTDPITDLNTQNTPLAIISTLILSTIADCLSPNR